ncbi:ATP-binding cassette domain-containing protein [Stygiolobus sp. CP850M]|jgi:molybdate/tungstate transport system ATP-binding protein|uniref:ATP-binding cassette domain-containing protein n=1 Tax=Stygiolobus sp. CP850M TaxID=3133134 RepID=UPI00307F20C5
MLEAKVRKKFQNFTLDSEIKDGSRVIAIFGKNGSGKSTFLKIIAGFLEPDNGYVKVDGEDITQYPPWKRKIVLVTPESFLPNTRVKNHLLWGIKDKKKLEQALEDERIKFLLSFNDHVYKQKTKELSLGMRQRLSLVTAILSDPRYILVDEVFSNINNKRDFIQEYFQLARERNINIVFVSQDLSDADFAERSYIMENGVLKMMS